MAMHIMHKVLLKHTTSHHIGLGLLDHLSQLAALVHFNHDVTPADELSGHVQLGDGRPLAEVLHARPDALVGQDVDGLEVDAEALQNLDGRVGEAALGENLGPLHEEEDGIAVDQALDALFGSLRKLNSVQKRD